MDYHARIYHVKIAHRWEETRHSKKSVNVSWRGHNIPLGYFTDVFPTSYNCSEPAPWLKHSYRLDCQSLHRQVAYWKVSRTTKLPAPIYQSIKEQGFSNCVRAIAPRPMLDYIKKNMICRHLWFVNQAQHSYFVEVHSQDNIV